VKAFQTRIAEVAKQTVEHKALGLIRNRRVTEPLIDVANARIPAESVKKVNEITTRFGNDIIKKD